MSERVRRSILDGRRAIAAELAALAAVGIAVLVFAIRGDWYEGLHAVLARHEILNLDEVLLAALVVTTLFALASVRRWTQLARRRRELDAALDALRDERDHSATVVARFEGILGSIDDFVWSQDALTREMLFVSPSVERIYGFTPEAMKANTRVWLEVIHPDDRERVAAYLPSLLSQGRAAAEYRIVREDGSIRFVNDRAWAIRDATGRMIRFDGIVRDVTEQKQLETQFRQSQKMEAVGLLAGGIAHDFNNLLTAVGGYAELLIEHLEPGDPRREHAVAVKRAGARAAALTRQLLAFSRRQVLQPRVFNLNELVGEMSSLLRRLVGEDVEVVLRPAPALGTVRADPGQIEQVLMNLVVNARDAMPRGGRMTIRTENVEIDPFPGGDAASAPGSYVALSVSDTGIGMDDAVRARIFEPFFTTKAVGKGTGLGLSTVCGIVEQSGGRVEVESLLGSGTTLRVLLPRHEGAAIPDGPALPAASPARPQGTLLVVEDESSVRELACEILEAEGYEVLVAADGREALDAARRHAERIRLVITDVVMPQMGGLELVENLSGVLPEASIVFMSGYSESVVRGEARFAAGAGFLQKPFTPAELVRQAREAFERAPRARS
jgi:two-component system, cell cycle sensor histidine kinase and response regulator CckA